MPDLDHHDVFAFFRMGLVTGLIDRQTVVSWADRALIQSPEFALTEVSLAGDFSFSRMIALLSDLQGPARYGISLDLLFARAGMLLERDAGKAAEIVRGLRLLCVEERLPREIKSRLIALADAFAPPSRTDSVDSGPINALREFLAPYAALRGILDPLIG